MTGLISARSLNHQTRSCLLYVSLMRRDVVHSASLPMAACSRCPVRYVRSSETTGSRVVEEEERWTEVGGFENYACCID